MNSKSRHLTRLSALVATIVGIMVCTAAAAQAAATKVWPGPGPDAGAEGGSAGSGMQQRIRVTEHSVSALQWVLLGVVVVAALLVGAALMQLAQRRRLHLAH